MDSKNSIDDILREIENETRKETDVNELKRKRPDESSFEEIVEKITDTYLKVKNVSLATAKAQITGNERKSC